MKKKSLLLIVFIVLFAFISKAKAYSPDLTSYCSHVCSDVYYSGQSTCENNCLSIFSSLDNSCGHATDEGGARFKCYVSAICKNYSSSQYCIDHEQGSKVQTDEEIQAAAEAAAVVVRSSTCRAANDELYNQNYSAFTASYDACVQNLNENGCKSKRSCKEVVCALTQYSSNGYCKSDIIDGNKYISSTASASSSSSSSTDDIDKKFNEGNCYGFGEVIYYGTLIVRIFQIVAPILLIIWASIDLFKSVIAGDEKKIIEMRKPIIRRFVAAVLIFFVPMIVNSIVSGLGGSSSWITCWKKYGYKDK